MNKRLFSGIQPSGNLHIGNYLGAIRQWIPLQDEYEAIFCVVDQHAITVPQDPAALRAKTLEIVKIYLAAGIDPSRATLFVQSHVPEHAELMWILNTIARNGELLRMTQLKSKSNIVDVENFSTEVDKFLNTERGEEVKEAIKKLSSEQAVEAVNHATAKTILKFLKDVYINPLNELGVGLFDYPVLMAADILLYDTAVVPVGKDQLQHIELARTLARRFNDRFGEMFAVPEGKVSKEGQLIMGLDDPTRKMSKSAASEYNYIALSDDADTVRRKIRKAVTDSGSEIAYQDDKPALRNLINIYSLLSEKPVEEIVAMYQGKGYGAFKGDLAEVIVEFLVPFQARLAAISDDGATNVLREGAEKARAIASAKMRNVRERVGFLS